MGIPSAFSLENTYYQRRPRKAKQNEKPSILSNRVSFQKKTPNKNGSNFHSTPLPVDTHPSTHLPWSRSPGVKHRRGCSSRKSSTFLVSEKGLGRFNQRVTSRFPSRRFTQAAWVGPMQSGSKNQKRRGRPGRQPTTWIMETD